ncbi:MAG: thiamine-phosphate kinase [Armatimonadota bacterium]|nr:thiamine-phosphate kinase [Armatimonadota bacterium]MDR7450529.1 thiamine-phosphate kinase [Armatimonadota bacterium]MDR7466338.1 thiamine-phosphate kinase [Armatimonadota bacterium]MDR7493059.1 thiamine-phosphate kinase [Armatimonadota bacterium]MDR7498184.1 thiamine-phosphate kinase [Armatimonadota bacterium]
MRPDTQLRLAELGEAGVLEAIRRIATTTDPDVIVGVGDDGAVVRCPAGRHLVATCDIQIDGVHFRRATAAAFDIGWKAMAINLSDVAAMGGIPRFALVSLALPTDLALAWVEELYHGLTGIGGRHGVSVIGGNLSRTAGPLTVDVTVLGEVEPHALVRRTGARPGDAVLVTGDLGASGAGRRLAERGLRFPGSDRLIAAHLRPSPRMDEGRVAALSGWATAMIDLSDGLALDLSRLCDAGGLGVRLDARALPIGEDVRRAAALLGMEALELALFGGEDYELLIASPPTRAADLARRITAQTGTPVTAIGTFVPPEDGRQLITADGPTPILARGWDHFGEAR